MAKKKDEDPIAFTPDKALDAAVENAEDVNVETESEDKPAKRGKRYEPPAEPHEDAGADSTPAEPSQPIPPAREFPDKTPALPSQPTR